MEKYPRVAEAIIEWKLVTCRRKGEETFCNECGFNDEICNKLSELAEIIIKDIEEGED